jgi:predicted lipoprotein with Yx(FWY)xxD motif
MRKSGWAAATGLGSLALLLAACGGSSTSAAGGGSAAGSSSQATGASSGSSGQAATSSPDSSASSSHPGGGGSSPAGKPSPHHTAGPQPSSGTVTFPSQGTTIMIVENTSLGFVLGEANGQVVYTYARDTKGGAPHCTGACAAQWPPATGVPQAGPADHFPGTFGVVRGAGGAEQITYNGYPLYLYKGAKPHSVAGNGVGGEWHVIPLSASDIG